MSYAHDAGHVPEADSSGNKNHAGAGAGEADNWRLEPHVCRVCFGRITSRSAGSSGREYVCTNCGNAEVGRSAAVACCCGLKTRRGGRRGTGVTMVDAGIRCHENTETSPAFPALYVASYTGSESGPD